MTSIKSVLFFISMMVAGSAFAQQTHRLTVKQAVELAFQNVIDIKNAEIDYRNQEALNNETFGRALPQVSGNIGTSYYLKLPQFLFPNAQDAGIYNILLKESLLSAGHRHSTCNISGSEFSATMESKCRSHCSAIVISTRCICWINCTKNRFRLLRFCN